MADRVQSVLGLQPATDADWGDRHAIELQDKPTAPGPAGANKGAGAAQPGTAEITCVGAYANPWATNPGLEARLVMGKVPNAHWSPGTDTMTAVANAEKGTVATCPTLLAILKQISGSSGLVSRVNILTHGRSGGIGMQGEIKATSQRDKSDPNDVEKNFDIGDVYFRKMSESFITTTMLAAPDAAVQQELPGALAKLGSNAVFQVYACDSGVDESTLKALAKFFNRPVGGLKAKVGYFVDVDAAATRILARNKTGVLGLDDQPDPLFTIRAAGFKHLNSHPDFVTVSP